MDFHSAKEGDHRSKISSGENFKGLPYVVLDFPTRIFNRMIFLRSGHYSGGAIISARRLQLKGRYKERYAENLKKNLTRIKGKDFYFSISSHEWAHQVNAEHYIRLDDLEQSVIEEMVIERPFLKLVLKTSLECNGHWPGNYYGTIFILLVNILAD